MEGNRKPKKGLTHLTLVGFFWSFSSTGVQAVLSFLVLAVLSRLLTPAETGLVNIANIFTVFAGLFYQLGIGPSLIQRQTITENHIRSGFTLTMILSVTFTVLTWFFAPVFASFFPIEGLTGVVRGMSFLFLLNGVGLVARSLNHRNLNFRIKARFGVISYVVAYGFLGTTLAFLGVGAWSLVWASLTQSFIYSALFLGASPHAKRPQLDKTALGDLLSLGSGFTLGQIFNRLANTSDNLIVARTMGSTAVGLYGKAYQLMVLPSHYFGQVLDTVLFTAMSKVQDRPETLSRVYRRGVAAVALVALPLSALLFFLAPEFIHVLLGGQWDAIIVPFKIFAVTMFFRTGSKMGDSLCRSAGVVFQRAFRQFIFSVMVIAGAWTGHYWGITGVTIGVSLAIAGNFLSMTQLSLQVTGVAWGALFRLHLPALLLTGVVGAETWLVAGLLRGLDWPDLAVLATSTGIIGVTLLGLIWTLPGLALGQEGLWVLKTVGGYLPKAVQVQMNKLQYR